MGEDKQMPTKYTPEPWHREGRSIDTSGGRTVVLLEDAMDIEACLIVEVPAMLVILIQIAAINEPFARDARVLLARICRTYARLLQDSLAGLDVS